MEGDRRRNFFSAALKSSNARFAPGLDDIRYGVLLGLSDLSRNFLLALFNRMFSDSTFPSSWRNTSVTFVPKPGTTKFNPARWFWSPRQTSQLFQFPYYEKNFKNSKLIESSKYKKHNQICTKITTRKKPWENKQKRRKEKRISFSFFCPLLFLFPTTIYINKI